MENLTNDDQLQDGRAVTDSCILKDLCVFFPTVFASIKGIHSHCAGQLQSLK